MEVRWYLWHSFSDFVFLFCFASLFRWRNHGAARSVLVNSGSNRTGCSRWVARPPAPTAPSGEALLSFLLGDLFTSSPPLRFSALIAFPCCFAWAGRAAARPRNAAKCTEWSARTSGAPPAAGRKPVSASPTKAGGCQTKTWMDGRMNECKRLLPWRGYINQGPRAITNHRFPVRLFCFEPRFSLFSSPQAAQVDFSVSLYSESENWSVRWC